jgi:hypothetical protein
LVGARSIDGDRLDFPFAVAFPEIAGKNVGIVAE